MKPDLANFKKVRTWTLFWTFSSTFIFFVPFILYFYSEGPLLRSNSIKKSIYITNQKIKPIGCIHLPIWQSVIRSVQL
ncbi:hypothetical protein BpHYR1_035458 [Brachionus plicatilis]|uniref:Uncharacterized protein n=1 Tax=Brachionus plicatilis TaxID=10195 RepID=A0A3M7SS39_BRAPC|nr:hypothetical protein BpHYR1_035458 [Brachionus plicatilis]